ncbi:MAG: carbon storage regulator [Planctomycetaceae bacterium]
MLVLSRKPEEAIVVGKPDDVGGLLKVTVLEIKQGRVRLGFEVAGDVAVHRWEVWKRIQSESQAGKAS